MLVTSEMGQPVAVWDRVRDRVRTFPGKTAAFSPDGRSLAVTGAAARVYDLESGLLLATLRVGMTPVSQVSFAPDGRSLITGAEDGVARIWSIRPRVLPTDARMMRAIAASPDGSRYVTAVPKTGVTTVRATDDGRVLARTTLPAPPSPEPIAWLAFSADGHQVLASYMGFESHVWPFERGRARAVYSDVGDLVTVLVSPDTKSVATLFGAVTVGAARDEPPNTSDGVTGTSVGTTALPAQAATEELTEGVFDRAGRWLAAGTVRGTVQLWDVTRRRLARRISAGQASVGDVQFSSDAKRLVAGSADSVARVLDARTGRKLLELRGHTDDVLSVAFSHDDRFIITTSADGTARFWDARSGRQLQQLAVPADSARPAILPGASIMTVMEGGTGAIVLPCDACAPVGELVREAERRLNGQRTTP